MRMIRLSAGVHEDLKQRWKFLQHRYGSEGLHQLLRICEGEVREFTRMTCKVDTIKEATKHLLRSNKPAMFVTNSMVASTLTPHVCMLYAFIVKVIKRRNYNAKKAVTERIQHGSSYCRIQSINLIGCIGGC